VAAKRQLLVVIPALNEEATVGEVVTAVRSLDFPVVVVDDCSKDGTARSAKEAGANVLRLPIHLGVGGALRTGFRYAIDQGYTAVVQVDADGQHPPDQIRDLIFAALSENAHLVIGSRYLATNASLIPTMPRRVSMWSLSRIASRVAGIKLTDTTSGFRLIREPLLTEFSTELPDYYLGDTFEATVAALRAGYGVIEIPASLLPRKSGTSSTPTRKALSLILKVILLAVTNLHPQLKRFHATAKP